MTGKIEAVLKAVTRHEISERGKKNGSQRERTRHKKKNVLLQLNHKYILFFFTLGRHSMD